MYGECAGAARCSVLAVSLQSQKAHCHAVVPSWSAVARALITPRVCFVTSSAGRALTITQKENTCGKLEPPLRLDHAFVISPSDCSRTSFQKRLVGNV